MIASYEMWPVSTDVLQLCETPDDRQPDIQIKVSSCSAWKRYVLSQAGYPYGSKADKSVALLTMLLYSERICMSLAYH